MSSLSHCSILLQHLPKSRLEVSQASLQFSRGGLLIPLVRQASSVRGQCQTRRPLRAHHVVRTCIKSTPNRRRRFLRGYGVGQLYSWWGLGWPETEVRNGICRERRKTLRVLAARVSLDLLWTRGRWEFWVWPSWQRSKAVLLRFLQDGQSHSEQHLQRAYQLASRQGAEALERTRSKIHQSGFAGDQYHRNGAGALGFARQRFSGMNLSCNAWSSYFNQYNLSTLTWRVWEPPSIAFMRRNGASYDATTRTALPKVLDDIDRVANDAETHLHIGQFDDAKIQMIGPGKCQP